MVLARRLVALPISRSLRWLLTHRSHRHRLLRPPSRPFENIRGSHPNCCDAAPHTVEEDALRGYARTACNRSFRPHVRQVAVRCAAARAVRLRCAWVSIDATHARRRFPTGVFPPPAWWYELRAEVIRMGDIRSSRAGCLYVITNNNPYHTYTNVSIIKRR